MGEPWVPMGETPVGVGTLVGEIAVGMMSSDRLPMGEAPLGGVLFLGDVPPCWSPLVGPLMDVVADALLVSTGKDLLIGSVAANLVPSAE